MCLFIHIGISYMLFLYGVSIQDYIFILKEHLSPQALNYACSVSPTMDRQPLQSFVLLYILCMLRSSTSSA